MRLSEFITQFRTAGGRKAATAAFALQFAVLCFANGAARGAELLTNGGIEQLSGGLPVGWDFRSNAAAGVNTSAANSHSGSNSLKFDLSVANNPEWDHAPFAVTAGSRYRVGCFYRVDATIASGGLDYYIRWWRGPNRSQLVSQDLVKHNIGKYAVSGWREVSTILVAPEGAAYADVLVWSGASGPAGLVHFDDFSVADASVTRIVEPRPYPTAVPRITTAPASALKVFDLRGKTRDVWTAACALQGIVNRSQPRVYTITGADDVYWLAEMTKEGVIQTTQSVASLQDLVNAFAGEIAGKVVWDPIVPGSIHAACMIASVTGAIPLSPNLSPQFPALTTVEDLGFRWTKNVQAYRYVFDNYWPQMNHFALAMMRPQTDAQACRDYFTAFKVFTFWYSDDDDGDPAQSTDEERIFVDQLLAATPANIPVFGWFNHANVYGISEYDGQKWFSGYGKFVPGTEFSTNLTVHSAISVPPGIFTQTQAAAAPHLTLDPTKVYVALNVLDSGDATWYWQSRQRQVWADPVRGSVPIGWCLNPTLKDTMPLVLKWYYQNATPNDYFFAAPSGLGYMFTTHYGEIFDDPDAVWDEFISFTASYCSATGLDAVETYDGGWGEPSPPPAKMMARYTSGIPGLRAMLPDFGHHDAMSPDNAHYLFDGVPVFHALTRWNPSFTVSDPAADVAYTVQQITQNTPTQRPAFMNTFMLSWTMFPTQIQQVAQALPSHMVPVTLGQLLDLNQQWMAVRNWALNGDFEKPGLASWLYFSRGPAAGTAQQVTSDRPGGGVMLRITRTTTGAFATEDLVLQTTNETWFPNAQVRPGHDLRLQFLAKSGLNSSQPFELLCTFMDSPDAGDPLTEVVVGPEPRQSFTATTTWQLFTMNMQAPASGVRRVQLGLRLATADLTGLTGDLYLDDVALFESGNTTVADWSLY